MTVAIPPETARAQRRPVRPDRQPFGHRPILGREPVRSTKAGPAGPATPDLADEELPHVPERSTKAGPAGPATRVGMSPASAPTSFAQRRPVRPDRQPARRPGPEGPSPPSLNEGRSGRTGNPATQLDLCRRRGVRSTKAGPAGPATHDAAPVEGRHDVHRSTKAGPAGPATPAAGRPAWSSARCAQRRPVRPDRQPPLTTRTPTCL